MKHGAPIDHFDVRVAEDLEFDVIQAMLAELAGCPSSEKRAESLVPCHGSNGRPCHGPNGRLRSRNAGSDAAADTWPARAVAGQD